MLEHCFNCLSARVNSNSNLNSFGLVWFELELEKRKENRKPNPDPNPPQPRKEKNENRPRKPIQPSPTPLFPVARLAHPAQHLSHPRLAQPSPQPDPSPRAQPALPLAQRAWPNSFCRPSHATEHAVSTAASACTLLSLSERAPPQVSQCPISLGPPASAPARSRSPALTAGKLRAHSAPLTSLPARAHAPQTAARPTRPVHLPRDPLLPLPA